MIIKVHVQYQSNVSKLLTGIVYGYTEHHTEPVVSTTYPNHAVQSHQQGDEGGEDQGLLEGNQTRTLNSRLFLTITCLVYSSKQLPSFTHPQLLDERDEFAPRFSKSNQIFRKQFVE